MAFRTRAFGLTDVGRARQENEDNFILVPSEGLYVVADGMGGHASGKLASTLAVTFITQFVAVERKRPDFQWPFPIDHSRTNEENLLSAAIKHANERIYIQSCKAREHEGMGTTVVSILDGEASSLTLGHAGDSRIYRFRNNTLAQITVDHSLVNHLLATKKITPAEAENFPNKNVIFRALGLKDYVDVDTQVVPKRDGDLYLLCSDGLTDMVDDWILAEILQTAHADLKTAAQTLIRLANHNGGNDNITVLLLAVDEVTNAEW